MRRVVVAMLVLCVASVAHGASASSRPGSAIWTHTLPSSPWDFAVDRGGGVVITDAGAVLAFRPSGRSTWRQNVAGIADTTPAIGADLVLIASETGVTAFSRADGAQRWQQSTASRVTSLALDDDLALIGDQSGALRAVDAASGAPRWSTAFEGVVFGARIDRSARTAVVGWRPLTSSAVRAFDLTTGTLRWGFGTGIGTATPIVRGGTVYIAQGDDNYHATVQAWDATTGVPRWETSVPGSFEDSIEPALGGGELVVVDHAGVVTVLDATTGHIRWQRDVAQFVLETRISLSRRRITFVAFSGDVFVLDRGSGRTVARATGEGLGGYVTATEMTTWPGHQGLLLATRLASDRLELRRIP